jgi:hypothetical protein
MAPAVVLFALAVASASIAASISRVVTDPSGAVIPRASVLAIDTRTGVQTSVTDDRRMIQVAMKFIF